MKNENLSGQDKRGILHWVNSLKGIIVVMVIFAHLFDNTSSLTGLTSLLRSLPNPVFFMISGILYHESTVTFPQFIKKKFSRIMIPFLGYAIFELIFAIRKIMKGGEILDSICGVLYLKGKMVLIPHCGL